MIKPLSISVLSRTSYFSFRLPSIFRFVRLQFFSLSKTEKLNFLSLLRVSQKDRGGGGEGGKGGPSFLVPFKILLVFPCSRNYFQTYSQLFVPQFKLATFPYSLFPQNPGRPSFFFPTFLITVTISSNHPFKPSRFFPSFLCIVRFLALVRSVSNRFKGLGHAILGNFV